MNNYEYIIAGLPVLQADYSGPLDVKALLGEIEEQLSGKDKSLLSFLLDGWDSSKLCLDFYQKAEKSSNSFIRDFFAYDRNLRNQKVMYLNKALGRPEGKDLVLGEEECSEDFEDAAKAAEVLSGQDILGRERGLDELLWAKADALTLMSVFNIDIILAFVCKMQIVNRWLSLDEASGREFFGKLVKDLTKAKGQNINDLMTENNNNNGNNR